MNCWRHSRVRVFVWMIQENILIVINLLVSLLLLLLPLGGREHIYISMFIYKFIHL